MQYKLKRPLLAAALLLGSTQASAASYTIAGEALSLHYTSGPIFSPGYDFSSHLNVDGLEQARFGYNVQSTLNIDLANLASGITGNLSFQPFILKMSPVPGGGLDGLIGSAWFSYSGDNYQISGGVADFDYTTRVLTLTGAHLLGGLPPIATGEVGAMDLGKFNNTDLLFSMTLMFSEDYRNLSGFATGIAPATSADIGELLTDQTWQYSIHEVPVPASAWLFGSALVGFSGLTRRRTS